MWLLILLLLLFSLLLLLPIRVEIDTEQEIYRASWRGIFICWVVPQEERWRWYVQLFFWQMEWKPGATPSPKEPPPAKKKPVTARRKSSFSIRQARAIFKNLWRAISMEHLRLNWDTGDFVLNAWLYPAFRLASQGQRQLFINFFGEQTLAMRLQTRPGLLVLAAMRVFLTLKT